MVRDCLFKYLYDFPIIFITKLITLVANVIQNLHMYMSMDFSLLCFLHFVFLSFMEIKYLYAIV